MISIVICLIIAIIVAAAFMGVVRAVLQLPAWGGLAPYGGVIYALIVLLVVLVVIQYLFPRIRFVSKRLMTEEPLDRGWTIYRRPLDFPHHYAVRQWWVGDNGLEMHPFACLCDTLEEARECIPSGTLLFPRDDTDDPVICETWL